MSITRSNSANALLFTLERQLSAKLHGSALLIYPPPLNLNDYLSNEATKRYSTLKSDIFGWEKAGLLCTAELSGNFDSIIIFPRISKEENLFLFAKSAEMLKQDGIIVACIPNEFGASRFEKEFRKLFPECTGEVKHHCRVFWGSGEINTAQMNEWLPFGKPRKIPGSDLVTISGVFSSNEIDPASKLLSDSLPKDLIGCGADLGAGYGYLSYEILKHSKIDAVELYECDKNAVRCAELNLTEFIASKKATIHWQDIRSGLKTNVFDWVVSNPPFHEFGKPSVSLGQSFIKAAHESLKLGGTLYFVCNKDLPYQPLVKEKFKSFSQLAETSKYQVIAALK